MTVYESGSPSEGTFFHAAPHKRNSWGAIFAGAIIVLGVQLLLATLGAAVGLTALSVSPEEGTAKGVGIGGAIWWVLTAIVALFAGGWVAGRLSGLYQRVEGILHGSVTWALATLVSVVLVTSALGAALGGAWNVLSTTATTAAQTTDQATLAQQGQQAGREARQAAEQAPQVAGEAAREAAGPSAAALWGIFAMMLLGLGAAALGGAAGVKAERKADYRPGMSAAA